MAEYGDGIIFIEEDALEMNSGLSEREATHGKVFQKIDESGVIITKNEDGSFTFDNYTFTGNYAKIAEGRKSESVYMKGPGFLGVPLYNLFSENKEKAILGVNFLSSAVEYAFGQNITLPNNGPLGTIIGEGKNQNQILILPPTLFEKSLNSRIDSEVSRYSGIYKRPLKEIDSWRFTLAVYAYKLCTEKDAFSNLDSLSRVWDYIDSNFVSPEYLCQLKNKNGEKIDTKELFSVIQNNLRVLAPEAIKKSKRNNYEKPKSIPLPSIPSDFSIEYLDFESNASYSKQYKKIKTVRFFRKNSLLFKIAAGVLCVVLLIFVSTLIDKKNQPSTYGLTPEETIEMMYSGFNQLNLDIFSATLEKKSIARDYENFISNMYVTGRVRETYESEKATFTLAQWLNLTDPVRSYFFGVTLVDITLLEETESGKTYSVDFYIVFNDPETNIYCFKENDVLELVFKKDRWKIASIQTVQENVDLDSLEFYNEIQTLADSIPEEEKRHQGAILAEALQAKYEWIPSPEEAEEGYHEIIEKYTSIFDEK